MTITLIDQYEHDRIKEIQENFPLLTYQSTKWGSRPNRGEWTEADLEAFKEVEDFLKKKILGFSSFTNFLLGENNKIRLRFEYSWTADDPDALTPFTGVGYLNLSELLNGFKK